MNKDVHTKFPNLKFPILAMSEMAIVSMMTMAIPDTRPAFSAIAGLLVYRLYVSQKNVAYNTTIAVL